MPNIFAKAFICITLFGISSHLAAQQLAVGDIFDGKPGDELHGWVITSEGLGENSQLYAVFDRENRKFIALTDPVVRQANGAVTVSKITHLQEIYASAGEKLDENGDCSFLGRSPVVAYLSKDERIVRGFFVLGGEIAEKRWFVDERDDCSYGGD